MSLAFLKICNCVSKNAREMILPPSFTCKKYNDKENDKKFMRILRNTVKNYTFFLVLRMFTLSCLFFRRIHVGKPVQVENYVCNTKLKCNYQFFIFLVCILWIFWALCCCVKLWNGVYTLLIFLHLIIMLVMYRKPWRKNYRHAPFCFLWHVVKKYGREERTTIKFQ